MNLNENINRIKQVMGLIIEQSEDELKKILRNKFRPLKFHGKFEKQGENIIVKGFSKIKNGNFIITHNPSDDFYVTEYIDGTHKGLKVKRFENKNVEVIEKSDLYTKYEEKIKNFPCLNMKIPTFIRQTNDGKIISAYYWNESKENIIYFNLDDGTYTVKGGSNDGEQGSFSCKGDKIEWGEVTNSGTNKTVTGRFTLNYFAEVTTSEPIVRGMRDHTFEPENGLIYQLQKKLKELNLYTGEPDGQFGPLTYQAVVAFQKTGKDAEGKPLVPDGKVGPKTIQSLGLKD